MCQLKVKKASARKPETKTLQMEKQKMNKVIQNALNEVRNNPTDTEKVKALTELAVPKFKELYGTVQKAVRTVNRHIGDGKGTPNRATIATAIGLADEVRKYDEVANLINLPEIADAVKVLNDIIADIYDMRDKRTYTHINYLPDFLTNAEKEDERVNGAKVYLYNIVCGVNRAVSTINRHIADGTFDPNTYKVAKAVGYKAELAYLRGELANLTPELAKVDEIEKTIDAVIADNAVGFINGIVPIAEYDPFPCEEGDGESETDGEEDDE